VSAHAEAGAAGPAFRLGTQGWNYPGWVGPLYPADTRAADFLRVYGRAFDTVEVDSTFYAVPPSRTVRGWAARTPPGFLFALKLPRAITHEARLRPEPGALEEFCDRACELGDKLGPILVQLGPDFGPGELPALESFLARLPADLRFAVEFRQRGWIRRDVYELLRAHRVAWALSDGRWIARATLLKLLHRPTSDFHYLRWMGPNRDLTDFSRVQRDRSAELRAWADVLRSLPAQVTRVFGYVNNHFAGHSPATARELQNLLGQRPVPPEELGEQTQLF
jgi:uncharacterized protein YecE (DUF72 family)